MAYPNIRVKSYLRYVVIMGRAMDLTGKMGLGRAYPGSKVCREISATGLGGDI